MKGVLLLVRILEYFGKMPQKYMWKSWIFKKFTTHELLKFSWAFEKYLCDLLALCSRRRQSETLLLFTGFLLKGTGSYLVWSQCFPHVGTIYLISMTNWLNEVLYDGKAASKCLKSGSHLPKKYFICFNESPLKMMKNAFYFILKVFFVFKIFKFLSWLFSYIENIAWRKR